MYIIDNWPQQIAAAFAEFRRPNGPVEIQWRDLNKYIKKEISLDILTHMCAIEPCMNYGECVRDVNAWLGFTCKCIKQFVGMVCDTGK